MLLNVKKITFYFSDLIDLIDRSIERERQRQRIRERDRDTETQRDGDVQLFPLLNSV